MKLTKLNRANGPPAADIRYLDPQDFAEPWQRLAYDMFTMAVYVLIVVGMFMALLIAYMRLVPVMNTTPVSDYHTALKKFRDAIDEAYRAEHAAYHRLKASPWNLHLRMKYDEAMQKLGEAQQAMDDYRGES